MSGPAEMHDAELMEDGDNQVEILLRRRAVAAAAQLLLHNGIEDYWTVDALIESEARFFEFKMKRNTRREKLQTVLKLFGFRNIPHPDEEDSKLERLDEIPETEEQREESQIVKFYVNWHYYWTLLVAVVEAWYLIVVPFRCCFEVPRDTASIICESLFLDSIMYLNIAVRCVVPEDKMGIAQWKGKNEEYVWSFWMVYDILANIPFDYLGLILDSRCTIAFNRCGRLAPYWQLNRLLNVRGFIDTTMEAVERLLQKLHIHPYAALVIVVTLVQTYFWHLFACFLFLDVIRRGADFELIQVVRVNDTDTLLIDAPLALQYAASLDWSSKVLAGWDRGAEFALDTWTFVYNAVTVLFGLCLMTTFVSFVSGLVEMLTPYIIQTMDVDMIFDFVNYKKGPVSLRDEMLQDSWYRYDSKTHMLVATEVLGDLPEELHDRLLHFEGQRVLGRVKLFAPLLKNKSFVINVAKQLDPCIMAPHEVLFEKGDAGESMFFIVDGKLGVVNEDDHSDVRFVLTPGMFVGEIALLLGASRTATVKVLDNFVRMLSLSKKEFELLRRRFPNTFAQVHQKARDRWMELNQPLLEKAKEIGRQEVEEIARKRFKLAQLKLHNMNLFSKKSANDVLSDSGSILSPNSTNNTDDLNNSNSSPDNTLGVPTSRKRSHSGLSVVAMQAHLKDSIDKHSETIDKQNEDKARFEEERRRFREDAEKKKGRDAGRELAVSMFSGGKKSNDTDVGNLSNIPSPGARTDTYFSPEGSPKHGSHHNQQQQSDNNNKTTSPGEQQNDESPNQRSETYKPQLVPSVERMHEQEREKPHEQPFSAFGNMSNLSALGMEDRDRTDSNNAVENQFFPHQKRARGDSQSAFMKQFLKDTMKAQALHQETLAKSRGDEAAAQRQNSGTNNDDDDDQQQQQREVERERLLHQQLRAANNNNYNNNNNMSNNSVFPNTSTAETDDPNYGGGGSSSSSSSTSYRNEGVPLLEDETYVDEDGDDVQVFIVDEMFEEGDQVVKDSQNEG